MKKFVILCLLATAFFACNKDDDSIQDDPLAGMWNLIEIQSGLAAEINTFAPDVITYFFADGKLTVVNNNTDPNTIFSFLPSGTYTYELSGTGDAQVLQITNGTYQVLTLQVDSLILGNDLPLDGHTITFSR